MTKTEAKRILADHVHSFSDQRLHEVYAFNQDGKMHWGDPCSCILGVTLADHLHQSVGRNLICPEFPDGHYMDAKKKYGVDVERAYAFIAYEDGFYPNGRGQETMHEILSSEIDRREYERRVQPEAEKVSQC